MAKKREKKDLKKIENAEIDDGSLSFKHWLGRAFVIGILLFGFVYVIEKYLNQPMLLDAVIAVSIVLAFGLIHEALHYIRAVKLGYNPKWFRTKIRMGFTIEHHSKGKWAKDRKKIAHAPYIVLIPASIILLVFGLYINHIGISIAGLGSLILHGISYPAEGKDE